MGVVVTEARIEMYTGGHVDIDINKEKALSTDYDEAWTYVQKLIRVNLGGRCAERIFFSGRDGLGSRQDLWHVLIMLQRFHRPDDFKKLENETYDLLLFERDTIARVANILKQKRKLFIDDIAEMHAEFLRKRETHSVI